MCTIFVAQIAEGLLSPEEGIWWERFERDVANIGDAVSWAIKVGESAPIESAMRWLPPAIHHLILNEAADWAIRALGQLQLEPSEIPATALTAAMGWHRLGGFDLCEEILADLQETDLDAELKAMLCFVRSTQQFMAGNASAAIEWGARCVETARDADSDVLMTSWSRWWNAS